MRYVITGGSGYIGGRLTELLVERDETERIVILDVRPPDVPWPKTEYVRGDVRIDARCGSCSSASDPTRSSTWRSSSTRSTTRRGCTTST